MTYNYDLNGNQVSYNLDKLEIHFPKPYDAREDLNKLSENRISDSLKRSLLEVNDFDFDKNTVYLDRLLESCNIEAVMNGRIGQLNIVSDYDYKIVNDIPVVIDYNYKSIDITNAVSKENLTTAKKEFEDKYRNDWQAFNKEMNAERREIPMWEYLSDYITVDEALIGKIMKNFSFSILDPDDSEDMYLLTLPEDEAAREWAERFLGCVTIEYRGLLHLEAIQNMKGYENDIYTYFMNLTTTGENLKVYDLTKKNVSYDEYLALMDANEVAQGNMGLRYRSIKELTIDSKQALHICLDDGFAKNADIYIKHNFLTLDIRSCKKVRIHLPFSLETVNANEELQERIFNSTSTFETMVQDYANNNNRYVITFESPYTKNEFHEIEFIFAQADLDSFEFEYFYEVSNGGITKYENVKSDTDTLTLPSVDLDDKPIESVSANLSVLTKNKLKKVIIPASYQKIFVDGKNGAEDKSAYAKFSWTFEYQSTKYGRDITVKYIPEEIEVADDSILFSVNEDKNILKSKDGNIIYMITDKEVQTWDLRCEQFSNELAQMDLRTNFHKVSKFLINYKINKYYFVEKNEDESEYPDYETKDKVYEFYKNADILVQFLVAGRSNFSREMQNDIAKSSALARKPIEISIYGVGDNTNYELDFDGCQGMGQIIQQFPENYDITSADFDASVFNYYKSADPRYEYGKGEFNESSFYNCNRPDASYDHVSYYPYWFVNQSGEEVFFYKRPVVLNLYGNGYNTVNVNVESDTIEHFNSVIELNLFDGQGNKRTDVEVEVGQVDETEVTINGEKKSLNVPYNKLHTDFTEETLIIDIDFQDVYNNYGNFDSVKKLIIRPGSRFYDIEIFPDILDDKLFKNVEEIKFEGNWDSLLNEFSFYLGLVSDISNIKLLDLSEVEPPNDDNTGFFGYSSVAKSSEIVIKLNKTESEFSNLDEKEIGKYFLLSICESNSQSEETTWTLLKANNYSYTFNCSENENVTHKVTIIFKEA